MSPEQYGENEMSIQNYATTASRNLIRAEMEMLKHAEPIQVIGKFGSQKEQPTRKTDTVVFRRLNPYNMGSNGAPQITAANFVTAEGTTPTANTIAYTDVSVTLNQYAVLFKFSSKAQLMYEDDIPNDMKKLTGETLGEVAELVAYGQIKAGSSVIYANGSTRGAVNTVVSINKLRSAARSMESNRAMRVTSVIKSGPNFDTSAVPAGYVVFCHTDCESDIRNLPNFIPAEKYGSAVKKVHEREVGACEQFRFVLSPVFAPYLAGGSGTLNGCYSAAGAAVDVYPMIVIAEDAFGHISLKGNGYTGISPTIIPATQKNHANPSGMFGYVGADFWYNSVRLNENWMSRIEAGVTSL
jgi:N4-gp56 family major capsid protein